MNDNELNSIFSQNLKRLRKEKKILQKDLAKILGVSNSIVSDWEKGIKLPRAGAIQKLSDYFKIPKSLLFEEIGTSFQTISELINLPIAGKISCGNGSVAIEEIEGYEPTPTNWVAGGDFFYLRAKGDSMINARIQNDDLLLIRKQSDVENGQIAAVVIDDEAVLKRVYKKNGTLILQSENPTYQPIIVTDQNNVTIIGKLNKVIFNL